MMMMMKNFGWTENLKQLTKEEQKLKQYHDETAPKATQTQKGYQLKEWTL